MLPHDLTQPLCLLSTQRSERNSFQRSISGREHAAEVTASVTAAAPARREEGSISKG